MTNYTQTHTAICKRNRKISLASIHWTKINFVSLVSTATSWIAKLNDFIEQLSRINREIRMCVVQQRVDRVLNLFGFNCSRTYSIHLARKRCERVINIGSADFCFIIRFNLSLFAWLTDTHARTHPFHEIFRMEFLPKFDDSKVIRILFKTKDQNKR